MHVRLSLPLVAGQIVSILLLLLLLRAPTLLPHTSANLPLANAIHGECMQVCRYWSARHVNVAYVMGPLVPLILLTHYPGWEGRIWEQFGDFCEGSRGLCTPMWYSCVLKVSMPNPTAIACHTAAPSHDLAKAGGGGGGAT
jgi:hypothetical protein